ncbi:MAG TPA: molybdopterin cofactor-binding domain-containing protein, partial [Cellvibrionaceae bacterium]
AAELALDRRSFLRGTGVLLVSLGVPACTLSKTESPVNTAAEQTLSPQNLDSWLALSADGRVTVFFGKMDMGQGVDTAIAQFIADELDVRFDRITVIMGDTALTLNQGGASSATGIETGSRPLRSAAAEARRVLLELASKQLNVPAESLQIEDGEISIAGQNHKQISYWKLIGNRRFNIQLETSGRGNSLNAWGEAKVKSPSAFKVVGTSVPRTDIPPKVFAEYLFVDKINLPGMWHGRMMRPPVAGAVPLAVNEASIAHIPEVQLVWRKNLLAVVAADEWHAVTALRQLEVTWSQVTPPFPDMDKLYEHIRSTPPRHQRQVLNESDVDAVLATAHEVISAEYEWPFHSHACMGPACAVADVRATTATIWTGSQKPHYTRDGIASLLGLPTDQVRAIWVPGPGSYGRNEADDAAADAAILSQELKRPVRVQYMRNEGHGWDPKGPAAVMKMRAGLDAEGKVIAYDWHAKGFSAHDVRSNASNPGDILTGHLLGYTREQFDNFGTPMESYGFANKRTGWDTIPPLLVTASPLRTAHIRDPQGPQTTFSSECFWDEVAAHLQQDPIAFRLRYLQASRDIAALKALAEHAPWDARPSPNPKADRGDVLVGRGVAYCQRGRQTIVAMMCEVEVNKKTGKVWPRRILVTHDCGLVVNPEGLRNTIEGAVMQAVSRTLWEEVKFDNNNVTSVDWAGYPILDIIDTPEQFEVVLLNDPEQPPLGAGEPAHKPVAAAIGNAVYDATGIRFRRLPLTPGRVLAGLLNK